MTDFRQINRLMGTQNEIFCQVQNGDFDDRLDRLMNHVDPYWEEREKTEMDVYLRQSPVAIVMTDDGPEEKTRHTSRDKAENSIVASELLVKGERSLELPE
jgi:hypothetical protein